MIKKMTVKVKADAPAQPKYETELAVTQALARRELSGFEANECYKRAREWQKYLKSLLPKFYRKPTGRKLVWLNNRPGYTMPRRDDDR